MIAFRRGHNFKSTGAKGYIDEVTEAEKIKNELKLLLSKYNIDHIDVSPSNMDSKSDLKYGVTNCNQHNADLFLSIHFNANKTTDKPVGCEIWTYNKKLDVCNNILTNLEELGFKNRGIKHNPKFYELKYTKCKAMIIEVCFVDSKADVDNYINVGYKKVAQAILNGLIGKCPLCDK